MERDLQDYTQLANLVKENNGLMISGFAGTGKSWPLQKILRALKDILPGKQLLMALRHAAAMIINGKTIQHYICKYRYRGGAPAAGTVCVIDEFSEVQLHTWVDLARWKLAGAIFILVGDADGQRRPICDRWQDAMTDKDIRRSQFLWELCGGTRVQMTTNRRGDDPVLFQRYCELYPIADDDSKLRRVIAEGLRNYPYAGPAQFYFVMSHYKRLKINAEMNAFWAAEHEDLLYISDPGYMHGVTMQPQSMILWHGIELQCCRRRYEANAPVNGAVYVVESWDRDTVTVRLHETYMAEGVPPATFTMPHSKLSGVFRLQFAVCYASMQGRTWKEQHVALTDLNNEHLTMRDVITGMSRPTNGRYLRFLP
jgi:hypothetical protein